MRPDAKIRVMLLVGDSMAVRRTLRISLSAVSAMSAWKCRSAQAAFGGSLATFAI